MQTARKLMGRLLLPLLLAAVSGPVAASDILGVRLGMTTAEAVAALTPSAPGGKVNRFDQSPAKGAPPTLQRVGIVMRSGDFQRFIRGWSDVVTVELGGTDPRVIAVARDMNRARGSEMHLDEVKAALVEKYGQPSVDGRLEWTWLWSAGGSLVPPFQPGRDGSNRGCQGIMPELNGLLGNDLVWTGKSKLDCLRELRVSLSAAGALVDRMRARLIDHAGVVAERARREAVQADVKAGKYLPPSGRLPKL